MWVKMDKTFVLFDVMVKWYNTKGAKESVHLCLRVYIFFQGNVEIRHVSTLPIQCSFFHSLTYTLTVCSWCSQSDQGNRTTA